MIAPAGMFQAGESLVVRSLPAGNLNPYARLRTISQAWREFNRSHAHESTIQGCQFLKLIAAH
jgi:hypothetical protein